MLNVKNKSITKIVSVIVVFSFLVTLGVWFKTPSYATSNQQTWTFTLKPADTTREASAQAQAVNYLTVYYVAMRAGQPYLVREVHPTTRKVLDWFAVDEVIHGQPRTSGVERVFNQEVWVNSIVTVQGRTTVDFTDYPFRTGVSWEVRELALQGIVNTLTEFPQIQRVRFTVKGSPYFGTSYWERDLSRVRTVKQGPALEITNLEPWDWIRPPLVLRGKVLDFTGLVRVSLHTTDGTRLAEGYAWMDEGKTNFQVRINYQTPKSWTGTVRVRTFDARTWEAGPSLDVPVLFARETK